MNKEDFPTETCRLAFLGLGTMGYPMAGHLARKGFSVTVYNRTSTKAQKWSAEYAGACAASPRLAAKDADIVFVCVGNDDDLRSVVLGPEGALAEMRKGSVLVDHTTDSAEVAREMTALCAQKGVHFIDAPVSGGQSGAVNGCLTVMAGGEEEVFKAISPVLSSYATTLTFMGPAGSGQLTKMCNQVCIASAIQGVAEALAFAQNAGLDTDRVIRAVSAGSGGSWQLSNRGKTMVEEKFDFGFAVKWMRKDLGIALAEARRNGSEMPVTEILDGFYADVEKMGGSRWDTSSLIMRLARKKR